MVMSISRLLVFKWALIVPHWWTIYSCIHIKLILYNIPKFNDYIDVIYSEELEIKDTTDAPKWANHLDLHLDFDEDGKLNTRFYDKCDDFDFPILNFPYLTSNIPESPAHGVQRIYSGFKVIEAGIFFT